MFDGINVATQIPSLPYADRLALHGENCHHVLFDPRFCRCTANCLNEPETEEVIDFLALLMIKIGSKKT